MTPSGLSFCNGFDSDLPVAHEGTRPAWQRTSVSLERLLVRPFLAFWSKPKAKLCCHALYRLVIRFGRV